MTFNVSEIAICSDKMLICWRDFFFLSFEDEISFLSGQSEPSGTLPMVGSGKYWLS